MSDNDIENAIRRGNQSLESSSTTKDAVTGESVVVTPCDDDHFEIHCHGGPAAVERIEEDLADCGALPADEVEHFRNGQDTLLIREAEVVLSRCETARIASIALNQVRGALLDWADGWRTALGSANASEFVAEASKLMTEAEIGLRITEPFRVVFVGPPNVGKSSLLNAIVGFDRSITLDVAGTTRDVLHADTIIDGLPLRFSDTAGIRDSHEPIERQGIARARLAADDADLLLLVSEPLPNGGFSSLPHLDALQQQSTPTLRVLNKQDRSTTVHSSHTADVFDFRTNAILGDGVQKLMNGIADTLGHQLPVPESPVLVNRRQADLVRQIVETSNLDQQLELLDRLIGRPVS